MSLINDALRRAKDAQQQAPPPPSPSLQFRPAEPAQHVPHGLALLGPAVWVIVALVAIFFVWQWAQTRESTGPREARARAPAAVNTTAAPRPASALVAVAAPAAGLTAQAKPTPRPVSHPSPISGAAVPLASDATSAPTDPLVASPQQSEATNTAVITVAPPKPAPPKLQAIIFNPKRPSAIISGKTLFIGDKLGALRVVAIDQESATLVAPGLTNILSLSK